mmetsp:Transcript_16034/g.50106  ORF Transcript_16034/g.50106 Transcript_16034/m.50106 type:complete len:415 (+) Transcript_16034:806-2050(+)
MVVQVEGRPVRMADNLLPPVRRKHLSVPTVRSVVGHLVGQVLAKADGVRLDARGGEELLRARQKVGERLVADHTVRDSLAGRRDEQLLGANLCVTRKQAELNILHLAKAAVRLGVLADKVLNLCEGELTNAQEALTRRNFVAERLTNLRAAKGEAASVELEESLKVDKDALGRLGPQEARLVAGRTNLRREHEVEGKGLRDGGAVRCLDLVLLEHGAKFFLRERVGLRTHVRVLVPLGRVGRLGDQRVHGVFKEVVGTVALLLLVAHHEILKLANVSGHVKHAVGGDRGTVDLQEGLANNEDVTPKLQQVLLDGTAGRAQVVQATDATVNLKGGAEEEATLQQIFASVARYCKPLDGRIASLCKLLGVLLHGRVDRLQLANGRGKFGRCLGKALFLQLAHESLELLELLFLGSK